MNIPRISIALCVIALLVSGCVSIPAHDARLTLADKIAASAGLHREDIATSQYTFASWRRIGAVGAPVRVYIAGDGLAWLTRHDPSLDPTPINPVALRLAATDNSPNVVFLARPCQYAISADCTQADWTSARFSTSILDGFNAALDALSAQYHVSSFELVGVSGGANIAGLLAARRRDIANLRTVAGDVDNDAFISIHDLSPMPLSLNMADEAKKLSHVPQIHFIGAHDDIVPSSISQSYARKAGDVSCMRFETVAAAAHETGWARKWQKLLSIPFACSPKGSM